MKTTKRIVLGFVALLVGAVSFAQNRNLDNFRSPDKDGINVFEAPKDTASTFENVKVRIGGAYTIQFQSVDHENSGGVELIEIGDNFNLATGNLDFDVALAKGVRLHLRTYLSSRHHPDAWVKGGYLQVDDLGFIKEGFLEDVMQYVTIKLGHMEVNYGDNHFRRTDNSQSIFNPFVGNYIMDAFTTEVGGEIYYRRNGFMGMLGVTNGKLNQSVTNPDATSPSLVLKAGFDRQLTEDLRFRITGSMYSTAQSGSTFLYNGDRAGSRYYLVMEEVGANPTDNFTSGRFNPGFRNQLTAFVFNPFVKYKGWEFFGTFERAQGRNKGEHEFRSATQYGAELLYRFGKTENLYLGGRYNLVNSDEFGTDNDLEIDRIQLGAGWFLTKNTLLKLEYVKQTYDGFTPGSRFDDGEFDGIMMEAVISF